jgi:two-component system CheB/CheR fusion protein
MQAAPDNRATRKQVSRKHSRPRKERVRSPEHKQPPPRTERRADTHTDPSAPEVAPQRERDFGIVGVGASAGGLEAFQELLSHLPNDLPLAFVLIPHLDPHHASGLVEILGRVSPLKVVEAADGMAAQVGQVAVIPPNTTLTIIDGVLRVTQRQSVHRQSRPIDLFLRSLAEDAGSRAIGVVLSGGLSDGALGVAAINAAGGVTFAQDPDSAKHDSMPRSAISSGAIDFVLPPAGIARELARIGVHPYVGRQRGDRQRTEAPDEERALQGIVRMLRGDGGIDFAQYRQTTFRRRIARRMLIHRLATLDAYQRQLKKNPAELRALSQDLLIDVTRFFRDPGAFEALQRDVLPSLVKRAVDADQPIRCWAPGCATGEETYSLAIALLEVRGETRTQAPIHLFGSDASETAIQRARRGVYPKNIEADVSEERLRRFFVRTDDQYQVRKSVRDLCVFARHDVLADPPFSNVDLVACRNLLIYLEPPAQKRVMRTFHYALKNEGILLLGGSETVGAFADLFGVVDKKHRIYAKKATSVRLELGAVAGPRGAEPLQPTAPESQRPDAGRGASDAVYLQREVDRILLGRYAPAAVLVNEAMEVLQFRGHTSPFLEPAPGHATFNVLRMAREGLLMPLRTTIAAVRKGKTVVRHDGLHVKQNGTFLRVDLEVRPVGSASGGRNYLVLFEEAHRHAREGPKQAGRSKPPNVRASAAENETLRHELASTKEFLQSLVEEREAANEELRSANEEILSSNEELQSTNEELQTAKEELQSTNEELNTVNEELQHRNTELTQLNDDLTNVLASVSLPMVIADSAGAVRRFTARAGTLFNLTAADVGRPLRTVRPNLGDISDLHELCMKVIDTAIPTGREAQDRDGNWWNVTVRPYKTTENQIVGAVIVLTDVTILKGKLDDITIARDYAEGIVDTVRSPLVVLNADLSVMSANPAFYKAFKVDREEIVGAFIYDLGNRQWNIPALRQALTAVGEQDATLTDFEVTHEFRSLGRRTVALNARQIHWKDQPTGTILLSFEDITERRESEPHA